MTFRFFKVLMQARLWTSGQLRKCRGCPLAHSLYYYYYYYYDDDVPAVSKDR